MVDIDVRGVRSVARGVHSVVQGVQSVVRGVCNVVVRGVRSIDQVARRIPKRKARQNDRTFGKDLDGFEERGD